MDSFFSKLKSSTEALHQAVERTALPRAIMAPEVKMETYTEYLSKSYTMHKEIEEQLFPKITAVIKDITERKKISGIEEDFKQLQSERIVSTYTSEAHPDGLNFILGMIYVTEGSTLGGLHILKNIRHSLGASTPGNFLNVYGEKTGTMWKNFLAQFNDYQATLSEQEREDIIAGALFGFERAKQIFEHEN